MRISMLWLLDSHAVGQTSVTSMGVRVYVLLFYFTFRLPFDVDCVHADETVVAERADLRCIHGRYGMTGTVRLRVLQSYALHSFVMSGTSIM